MHPTKEASQWHFGFKAHVGTDTASGLAHSVVVTAAKVREVTQANALLRVEEQVVFANAGYRDVDKRLGKRNQIDNAQPPEVILEQIETVRARIRLRGERIFGTLKCTFRYTRLATRV
ncbi:MAG: transposase [Tepidimonas sp.]|nr:transposase [Tepidimonas sp.]